jgi:hypothetical protein
MSSTKKVILSVDRDVLIKILDTWSMNSKVPLTIPIGGIAYYAAYCIIANTRLIEVEYDVFNSFGDMQTYMKY